MEKRARKCLFCNCVTKARHLSSIHSSQFCDFTSTQGLNSSPLISSHVYVIFILRKILHLPVDHVAKQLERNENLTEWIAVCKKCDKLVGKCKETFDQLQQISREFHNRKLNMIKIIKASCTNNGNSCSSTLGHGVEHSDFVEESRLFVSNHNYGETDHGSKQGVETYDEPELPVPESTSDIGSQIKLEISEENGDDETKRVGQTVKTETDEVTACSEDDALATEESMNLELITGDEVEDDWEQEDVGNGDDGSENEWNADDSDQGRIVEYEETDSPVEKTENDGDSIVKRQRSYRKSFKCPFCQNFNRPIILRCSLKICDHVNICSIANSGKCFNTGKIITELKCQICFKYHCSTKDLSTFINHMNLCFLRSNPRRSTRKSKIFTLPMRYRIFQCNICTETPTPGKRKEDIYFRFDEFLNHYQFHKLAPGGTYKCSECGESLTSMNYFHDHWKQRHKPFLDSAREPEFYESKLNNDQVLPRVPWWCLNCEDVFNEESKRDEHISSQHPNAARQPKKNCQYCDKGYRCADELKLHEACTHTLQTSKIPQCVQCFELFEKEDDLSSHRRQIHNMDLLECSVCRKGFDTSGRLFKHKAIHEKKNENDISTLECSLKCPYCDKRSFYKHIILQHIAAVHEKCSGVICQVCGNSYTTKYKLNRHLRNFHPEMDKSENYKCTVEGCKKVFTTLRFLRAHLSTHCTVHSCSFCGKEFNTAIKLRTHEKGVHLDKLDPSKQFQCSQCPFKTRHASSMSQHRRKVHALGKEWQQRKNHSCEFCQESVGSHKKLVEHKKICPKALEGQASTSCDTTNANQKSFVCEICGASFTTKHRLTGHKTRTLRCKMLHMSEADATVTCNLCGKVLASKTNLTKHIREVHEGIYKETCEHCGRKFDSAARFKRHLVKVHQVGHVEAGLKELTCPEEGCGKTFVEKRLLRGHLAQHKGVPEHTCEQCGKSFFLRMYLSQHQRVVHEGWRPKKKPKKE